MHKERFARLIKAVEDAPPPKFDMGQWASECGTAACAIGTYCIRNPRAALRLKPGQWTPHLLVPTLVRENTSGIVAVAMYFELSFGHAEWLFMPHEYYGGQRTRRAVLARLKKFYKDQLAAKGKKVTA